MDSPFDEADVISLDIGFQRQLLLRKSRKLPPLAENFTECQPCVQTMSPSSEGCTVGCMAVYVFTVYCEFLATHGTIRPNAVGFWRSAKGAC